MLIFPTAVLAMSADFDQPYGELVGYAVTGFITFGVFSMPAGWLADRWSRHGMMVTYFFGTALTTLATGFAREPWHLGLGMAAIGMFAAIYHPVGNAMLVNHVGKLGRSLGINGVFGNVGVASSALITGALCHYFGWRWAFWLPGLLMVGLGLAYISLVKGEAPVAAAAKRDAVAWPPGVQKRAFAVLALVTLCGGLVFNATTVAMPKVFAEKLGGSTLNIGFIVCGVYLCGAVAQLLMGWMLDRFPLKRNFVLLSLLQAPFLALLAVVDGGWSIVAGIGIVFAMFGQVTINDGIIARYADRQWRSRIYAVRYFIAFGASASAVPLVAWSQGGIGAASTLAGAPGFAVLFAILTAFALTIWLGSLAFPATRQAGMGD